MIKIAFSSILFFLFFMGCSSEESKWNEAKKTNPNELKSVRIGNQIWSLENLNTLTFRNGDSIPLFKTEAEWYDAWGKRIPGCCYYDDDSLNGKKYGLLYNAYAVNDKRGLAPKGWHIPSVAEWDTLISFLGRTEVAGKHMKSTTGWEGDNPGTNRSGFTALPGGGRYSDGQFWGIGTQGRTGRWWSSKILVVVDQDMDFSTGIVINDILDGISSIKFPADFGSSVRVIKD